MVCAFCLFLGYVLEVLTIIQVIVYCNFFSGVGAAASHECYCPAQPWGKSSTSNRLFWRFLFSKDFIHHLYFLSSFSVIMDRYPFAIGSYLIVIAFMDVIPLPDKPLLKDYVHPEVIESNSGISKSI